MKIKDDVFNHMFDEINKFLSSMSDQVVADHEKYVRAEGKAQDLAMRMRWDIYFATPGLNSWICKNTDVNDSHIDTALRKIMGSLGFEQYSSQLRTESSK